MKQLTVTLQNHPGALAQVCESLSKSGVNIISIFGGGILEKGLVHLITADETSATKALERAGYTPKIAEIVTVKLLDRPGELAKATLKLAHAGVNVESLYLLDKSKGEVTLALQVDDSKKALETLK